MGPQSQSTSAPPLGPKRTPRSLPRWINKDQRGGQKSAKELSGFDGGGAFKHSVTKKVKRHQRHFLSYLRILLVAFVPIFLRGPPPVVDDDDDRAKFSDGQIEN